MTRSSGVIANWVCFVKSFRIDCTVTVYTDVDVYRGWCRDPLASPFNLEALQLVVRLG